MKNLNILKAVILLFTVSLFVGCDEGGEPDPGGTTLEAISGDWWVIALEPDGETPAYGGDYVQFSTYNTAANDLTFWLDDHDNWMEIKAKATVNLQSMTFSSEVNTPELYTDGTVTVTNGMFTKNSYTTASNTVVDEITFEAEFDWDPGTVYIFKGHKRTGFLEDENPHF
jgi:hypothetical protein